MRYNDVSAFVVPLFYVMLLSLTTDRVIGCSPDPVPERHNDLVALLDGGMQQGGTVSGIGHNGGAKRNGAAVGLQD